MAMSCLMVMSAMGCSKGVTPPASTGEVYILDGLLMSYGASVPCYGASIDGTDIEENAFRCSQPVAAPIKPQYPTVPLVLDPFAVDQTEVSNLQYRHCVAAGVCEDALATSSFEVNDYYYNPSYDDFPVNNVTWRMADTYCAFRGRRLLHDAEWQRIAQGNPASLNGTLRSFPADGIYSYEDCAADGDTPINAAGCNAQTGMSAVDTPGNDVVTEGYEADGQTPSQIFHLFSNVSEWVDDWYDAEITCKASIRDLPDDPNDPDDWKECLDYQECEKYPTTLPNPDNPALPGPTNPDRILCDQEAKFCEACAENPEGVFQEGDPGTLNCFLSCQGQSRGYPMCEAYEDSELPLTLAAVKATQGQESKKILRGGNVGVIAESQMCRFKSDYRGFRLPESGTQQNTNNATGNGVGFRCARDLTTAEIAYFETVGFSFNSTVASPDRSTEAAQDVLEDTLTPEDTVGDVGPAPEGDDARPATDAIDPTTDDTNAEIDDAGPVEDTTIQVDTSDTSSDDEVEGSDADASTDDDTNREDDPAAPDGQAT